MEEQPAKKNCIRSANELPMTVGNFTNQESWDSFFTSQGVDDFPEWYANWPQIRTLLRNHLSFPPSAPPPEKLNILVPACGNSTLSEHLYDEGFKNITNVDFSKVVISAMLGRNVKDRPQMNWSVMEMTNIQFANGTFDAIVDKAGLDALMESELAPRSGILYISEVKRLLKSGGKYICFTLAESHVLGILFSKFRFGWKINLYSIAHEPSSGTTKQQTFMLVAEKSILTVVSQIVMDGVESQDNQVHELFGAVERENTVRAEYSAGTDTWHSLEDLKQGVKGNIRVLEPGRIVKLFLGKPGVSRFFYTGVLLDAHSETEPFSDRFRVLFFKKTQSSQKIIAAEFRQWLVLGSLKAARLLMIVLDSSHSNVPWDDIVKDIYHFVNQLAPVEIGDEIDIVATSEDDMIDGIKQRKLVYQVISALTGPIFVEDVIYDLDLPKDIIFRRLCFERTESLVHSEAPLSTEGPHEISGQVENKKGKAKIDSHSSDSQASNGEPKLAHNFLITGFHKGIIAGLLLFSLHPKRTTSADGLVKTVIIGLGPGILPMFMRNCLPTLQIEVVELDPVVLNVASAYFGFIEDERLKVHITDATKFVREKSKFRSSSGLISPEADFVEESFLLTVKDSLSDNGLFIFKLVSRYSSVRGAVYSKLRTVFSNLYHFYVDGDFVEIIFALKDSHITAEDELTEACDALERSLQDNNQDWAKRVLSDSKLIKPLPR